MVGIYQTTKPEDVSSEMDLLIQWYFKQNVTISVLAEFHARYESIHHFKMSMAEQADSFFLENV